MSVQTQINRIKTNIADVYAKAQTKGATLPADQNTENLASTIESIPDTRLPEGLRTITLTADPPEGGSVSGGGMAEDGMEITIRGSKNEGFQFDGWFENDTLLSKSLAYSFITSQDRSLSGNFSPISAGEQWSVTSLPDNFQCDDIAYGDGVYVAVTSVKGSKVLYSTDAVEWHTATLPADDSLSSVAYNSDKHMFLTANGFKTVYLSGDGINWEAKTATITSSSGGRIGFVAYAPDYKKWVSMVAGDSCCHASSDGVTWNYTYNFSSGGNQLSRLRGNKTVYLFSQYASYYKYTGNGNFSNITANVTFGGTGLQLTCTDDDGTLYVAKYGSTTTYWQGAGTKFYAKNLPSDFTCSKIIYGDGKLLVLQNNSTTAYYLNDGETTWNEIELPEAFVFTKALYLGGKFIVIPNNSNKLLYS